MNKQPSVFGGACIIASVCVGAGMLGQCRSGCVDALDLPCHARHHDCYDHFRLDAAGSL